MSELIPRRKSVGAVAPFMRTRRFLAWAFGEVPVQRFVDAAFADLQSEYAQATALPVRLRVRARALAYLATVLPVVFARSTRSSAVVWGAAPILLLVLGQLVLSQKAQLSLLQARSIVIGLFALALARPLYRLVLRFPFTGGLICMAAATLPMWLRGAPFVDLPVFHIVVWPELTRVLVLIFGSTLMFKASKESSRVLGWAAMGLVAMVMGRLIALNLVADVVIVGSMMTAMLFAGARFRIHGIAMSLTTAVAAISAVPRYGLYWRDQVPEPEFLSHTDFVLDLVGAKFGLMGVAAILGTLLLVGVLPLLIVRSKPARIAAKGFLAAYGVQVGGHFGASFGLLPVLGLPLPAISYGGSALVSLLLSLGWIAALERSAVGTSALRSEPYRVPPF